MGAAPTFAQKADGMRVVHHHERIVLVGEVANRFHVGNDPVHRKHAIRRN